MKIFLSFPVSDPATFLQTMFQPLVTRRRNIQKEEEEEICSRSFLPPFQIKIGEICTNCSWPEKAEWERQSHLPHWKALQKIGQKILLSFDEEPYLRIFPMVGFLLLLLGFQFYEERWCLVRGKSCGVSHSRRQIGHHWREQNIIQKNLKKINQIYKMMFKFKIFTILSLSGDKI